jgi:hypothetical protein
LAFARKGKIDETNGNFQMSDRSIGQKPPKSQYAPTTSQSIHGSGSLQKMSAVPMKNVIEPCARYREVQEFPNPHQEDDSHEKHNI